MRFSLPLILLCAFYTNADYHKNNKAGLASMLVLQLRSLFPPENLHEPLDPTCYDFEMIANVSRKRENIGCICGMFLDKQFRCKPKEQPEGDPLILQKVPDKFPCHYFESRKCIDKCLNLILKYLPASPATLCQIIGRDCYKERAHLFIKNCEYEWTKTNLSTTWKYCCKDGIPYKCPLKKLKL